MTNSYFDVLDFQVQPNGKRTELQVERWPVKE